MALDRINATALLDGGVTTADIADDAVTSAKLATQTGNVDFADNGRIRLGDSQDLQIYHDGSASDIKETGTGNLRIWGDDIQFFNSAGSKYHAQMITDGAVNLYYNGAIKLATTSTGVDVTGTLTVDSNLLVGSSSAVGNANANELELTNPAGSGTVGMTFNVNSGSADTGNIYWRSNAANNNIQIVGDPVSNYLAFATSGTERVRIDNTGKVGIGVSSPSAPLEVAASSNAGIRFSDIGLSTFYHRIYRDSDNTFHISTDEGNIISASAIKMSVDGTEAMRIDSGGGLRINTTGVFASSNEKVTILGGSSSQYDACITMRSGYATGSTGVNGVYFQNNAGGLAGYINWNGSSTSYVTSSDYRLKENVTADWDATTRLKQLNPVRFNFITDTDKTVDGFLAHEVQDIVPEAISGTHNGMRDEEYEVTPAVLDEDGNEVTPAVMATRSVPEYQGIDQAKLVPLLVKSLQEALDKIDTLETRLEALENA